VHEASVAVGTALWPVTTHAARALPDADQLKGGTKGETLFNGYPRMFPGTVAAHMKLAQFDDAGVSTPIFAIRKTPLWTKLPVKTFLTQLRVYCSTAIDAEGGNAEYGAAGREFVAVQFRGGAKLSPSPQSRKGLLGSLAALTAVTESTLLHTLLPSAHGGTGYRRKKPTVRLGSVEDVYTLMMIVARLQSIPKKASEVVNNTLHAMKQHLIV
jgi:hypothetical protein